MVNKTTLKRNTLTSQVYEYLHNAIIDQEQSAFRMGKKIHESEIAKMLGCSTTPVREAINMLRREGLIFGDSYKSSKIAHFGLKDIENLLIARNILEIGALQQAFSSIDEELIQRLEANFKQYEDLYVRSNDRFSFANIDECNRKFHLMLIEKSNNAVLNEMIQSIVDRLAIVRAPVVREREKTANKNDTPPPVKEHFQIVEAIKAGNEERAVAMLLGHINRVKDGVMNFYSKAAIENYDNYDEIR